MTNRVASLAGICTILIAPVAQAGPIWSYSNPANESVKTPGADAGLTFQNTLPTQTSGDQSIPATSILSWSLANAGQPDRVAGELYHFGLLIKDYTARQEGMLSFSGILDGTIWKNGSALTNTFTGATSQSLDLGANRYDVTLDAFKAPTGFGEAGAGQIMASVAVTDAKTTSTPPTAVKGPVATAQTPEPSTIALGGIAAAVASLFGFRRLSFRRHFLWRFLVCFRRLPR
jgi:hypothetical protein